MSRDVGIILKSLLPYKYKISVLSRYSGKVSVPVSRAFSPGTIISLPAPIEVLHVPLSPLDKHLAWIHHLLEICYYFVPLHSACPDVFRLLQYSLKLGVQSNVFEPHFYIVKRICLVRLLVLLGFYPNNKLVFLLGLFDDLVAASLDSSNDQKVRSLRSSFEAVTEKMIQEIDKWMLYCLKEHPHVKQFKTLSFFYVDSRKQK